MIPTCSVVERRFTLLRSKATVGTIQFIDRTSMSDAALASRVDRFDKRSVFMWPLEGKCHNYIQHIPARAVMYKTVVV